MVLTKRKTSSKHRSNLKTLKKKLLTLKKRNDKIKKFLKSNRIKRHKLFNKNRTFKKTLIKDVKMKDIKKVSFNLHNQVYKYFKDNTKIKRIK